MRGTVDRYRGALLKGVLLPLGDTLFRQHMMKRLQYLSQAQWWPAERIHARRNQAVADLMKIAYEEVPFYRFLMESRRLKPSDLRTTEDLAKLPVVTKTMLREWYPQGTFRSTGLRTYEASSSGSTGTNFRVHEDASTAGWYRASTMLALNWAGWQIGEPHVQTGMTLKRSFERRLKDLLFGCHYVSAYDLTDSHLDEVLEHIDRHRIRHLWGYPGSLYYLARRALSKRTGLPLKSVVTWGDALYPHYRSAIETAFGVSVFDTYGCGEGIQIAAQCGVGTHYHVHSLDVIVEYRDESEEPVKPGETGNLIVTRLHPGPMPLIRYRIGDLGVSGGTKLCRCGRGFEILESIAGRDTDVVITPSQNRLIVHFFTGILEHFSEIQSFQVVQSERDSIRIRVVPASDPAYWRELENRIVGALHEKGLVDMRIDVEPVDEIPCSASGKRRFVINELVQ